MKELNAFRKFLAEGTASDPYPADLVPTIIDMMIDEGILTKDNWEMAIPYIEKAAETEWVDGNDEHDVGRVAYKAMKADGILEGRSKQKIKEAMLDPKVKDQLERLFPEETPGSWDDDKDDFVVPFEHIEMIPLDDDLEAYVDVDKVPTDWVLISQWNLEDGRRPNDTYIARSFARLVPGKGIELKSTTDFA
jgi:hypothetical protein